MRLALWAMPGSLLLRYVGRQVDGAAGRDRREASIERLVWSVRAAARRVPGTTCLVEALAAQLVLARNGQSSQLRIGVRRGADQEFSAHAWVQVNGRIVIGARPGEWYYPLPDLDPLLRRGVRG